MKKYLKVIIITTLILVSLYQVKSQPESSKYQFQETVELINLVESAAHHFSETGEEAFRDFSRKNSKWLYDDKYLFIYNLDGVCIFHPINKELQGQNLIHLEDMNGKPIIQFIVNIASKPKNQKGWVHFLFADHGDIFPSWKSAYVMRVTGPDGTPYAIGSGTYDIRIEKAFMIDVVDSVANLIAAEGEDAFEQLLDKKSIFYFSDIYVFVISTEGKAIVDPAFPGIKGRDLINFQDGDGKYVVKEMIEKLKTTDKAFIVYMWPKPGESKLSKKIIYSKNTKYMGKTVIVGSGIFQINPIWNKF